MFVPARSSTRYGFATLVVFFGALCLTSSSGAIELQRSDSTSDSSVGESFEGWFIDSIEIDNRNIYDLKDVRYQSFLFRTANRLHIVTRDRIIRQALLFEVGERLDQDLIDETARNLRLQLPLNDAWIQVEKMAAGRVLARVITVDQWSLLGGLRSVSRSGNETDFRIGFEERNLIGRAQYLSFDFFARENDPNYVQMRYREPRAFGRPVALGVRFRSDPNNRLWQVDVGRPHYSLAQKMFYDIAVADHSQLVERLDSVGEVSSQWVAAGETVRLESGYRVGPSHSKTLIKGEYRYLNKVVVGESDVGIDSVYHRFAFGLAHAWQEYITDKRIRGFGYTEDITLGVSVEAMYGRAFLPGFKGYLFDKAEGEVIARWKLGDNLIGIDYWRVFWLKGSHEIRRQYGLGMSIYNNRMQRVTWAARSQYVLDWDGEHLNVLLGGRNGIRGYPRDFRAGDRSHVMNFEGRFFLGLELLSVKVGSVVFVDLGRTWQPDETLAFRDYHVSGGFGLRLSLENLLKGEIIRMDVALAEGGDWELSFGTGQYF